MFGVLNGNGGGRLTPLEKGADCEARTPLDGNFAEDMYGALDPGTMEPC